MKWGHCLMSKQDLTIKCFSKGEDKCAACYTTDEFCDRRDGLFNCYESLGLLSYDAVPMETESRADVASDFKNTACMTVDMLLPEKN